MHLTILFDSRIKHGKQNIRIINKKKLAPEYETEYRWKTCVTHFCTRAWRSRCRPRTSAPSGGRPVSANICGAISSTCQSASSQADIATRRPCTPRTFHHLRVDRAINWAPHSYFMLILFKNIFFDIWNCVIFCHSLNIATVSRVRQHFRAIVWLVPVLDTSLPPKRHRRTLVVAHSPWMGGAKEIPSFQMCSNVEK
jgi:hypothetical protein